MRAACWTGKQRVSIEQVPDPQILNARDAIVRVTATTISHGDPEPHEGDIPGHELMGEVVELGKGVANLRVGDRVVVPSVIACGNCESCEHGNVACCENSVGAFGSSRFPGGLAEYVRVPYADTGLVQVSPALTDEQVLFLSDILPTGYMGAELCAIDPTKVIAVWGAGPVGQLAIASAKLLGAKRIIAIDRIPYRLKLAVDRAGATDVINYDEQPVLETLRELTAGRGPDACIDAADPVAAREAITACRSGGIVVMLGDRFQLGALMSRGITIKTGPCHVHRYMKPLLERIEKGDIDPSFVVSHRMHLDAAAQGYDMMRRRDNVMKVVLRS